MIGWSIQSEWMLFRRTAIVRLPIPEGYQCVGNTLIVPIRDNLMLQLNLIPVYQNGPRSTETISRHAGDGTPRRTPEHCGPTEAEFK